MRVLHVTPELPFATGGGGRGTDYFLLRRLAERGHQVLNVSPVPPAEMPWAQALRDVGVENWVVPRPASHLREALGAVLAEPSILATAVTAPVRGLEMRIFWQEIRETVKRAARDWRPDVAIVSHGMAADWRRGIGSQIPCVLTLYDLAWHWYLTRARREPGIRAQVLRYEARRFRRHLLQLLPQYSAAICVSTLEADELRAVTTMPVSAIPVAVDTSALHPAPEQPGPPRLLFTGTLSYPPNVEGIRWFADRVWPLVRRRLNAAELVIVGRDPTPAVLALNDREGVSVVGPVPDMAPYFAQAHVVIVPILTGAGIRVKIVEAMAAGRAIVSTTLGCQGLPYLELQRHLLVADDPDDFASAAVRLLKDDGQRREMADEARRLAEAKFDWRALGDERESVLTAVVNSRKERPAV